jgi:hypothetical protein
VGGAEEERASWYCDGSASLPGALGGFGSIEFYAPSPAPAAQRALRLLALKSISDPKSDRRMS